MVKNTSGGYVGAAQGMAAAKRKPVLLLGYTTAALVWRSVRLGIIPSPRQIGSILPEMCIHTRRDVLGVDMSALGCLLTDRGLVPLSTSDGSQQGALPILGGLSPLDVLVLRRSQIHRAKGIRMHLLSQRASRSPFFLVDESLAVVGPELCFAQTCLANRDLPNIELAMELMGSYALGNAHVPWRTGVEPLFDKTTFEAALDHMGRVHGRPAALRAIRWAGEGSASPRETELFLVLTLPPAMGGFGLPQPAMNERIDVSRTPAARFTRDLFYMADLLWEGRMLIVEYDGREHTLR